MFCLLPAEPVKCNNKYIQTASLGFRKINVSFLPFPFELFLYDCQNPVLIFFHNFK